MSYEHSFSLKVRGTVKKTLYGCIEHQKYSKYSNKFCEDCGKPLERTTKEIDGKDIIPELLAFGENCSYLLDEEGNSYESGSGYNIEEEIKEFSKKYPSLMFILTCNPENGMGNIPEITYIQNDIVKQAKTKLKIINPFTNEEENGFF